MYDKIVNSYHQQCFEFCVGVVEYYERRFCFALVSLQFQAAKPTSCAVDCLMIKFPDDTLFAMYRHPKVSL